MKIAAQDISNIQDQKELQRYLGVILKDLITAINGKISISDNLEVSSVSATFSGSGVSVAVSHGLARIPVGYIVAKSTTGIVVFDGTTANTDTTLYVQATGAGTVTLIVY